MFLCFTLVIPNIIYAGSAYQCDDKNNCIDDLIGQISDGIKGNIPGYQDLLTKAITPKEYLSTKIEAALQAAQQKAEEFASKLAEAEEAVQQAADTLEATQQEIASGNYAEPLIVILGDYTGNSAEIQTNLEDLQKLVKATQTLYDVGSEVKACADNQCIANYIAAMPEPHVSTMADMESALDVANLRCSEEVPLRFQKNDGQTDG